ISACTAPTRLQPWPPPSTRGPERRLIGRHPQRRLTGFSYQPTKIVLRRPLESAQYTDRERHTPSPFVETGLGQRQRQQKADESAREGAQVLTGELPAAEEHPPVRRRGLEQEHRRRTNFASD